MVTLELWVVVGAAVLLAGALGLIVALAGARRRAVRAAKLAAATIARLEVSVAVLEAKNTNREELEQQLREGQKLEAIGQLAGGIAHDFNNLLTAILGNAELLRMGPGNEGIREEIDEILRAGRRGSELVRQMLSFARRSPGQIVPIDLHQSIEDTVSLLRRGTSPR
ncbi:MAG: hypothetical protein JNJ59_11100, partial [Deltaproteobacteria bacterium]|nr:hypothetical protein [Deltaproteobacteria bacterium]